MSAPVEARRADRISVNEALFAFIGSWPWWKVTGGGADELGVVRGAGSESFGACARARVPERRVPAKNKSGGASRRRFGMGRRTSSRISIPRAILVLVTVAG